MFDNEVRRVGGLGTILFILLVWPWGIASVIQLVEERRKWEYGGKTESQRNGLSLNLLHLGPIAETSGTRRVEEGWRKLIRLSLKHTYSQGHNYIALSGVLSPNQRSHLFLDRPAYSFVSDSIPISFT